MPEKPDRSKLEIGREQPHSIEAEEGLLAACLIDGGDIVDECLRHKLTEESFFKTAHQIVFKELLAMRKEDQPVDEIVLFERLKKSGDLDEIGGISAIYSIQGRIDTPAHARYYAKIVSDNHVARRMLRMSREAIEAIYEKADEVPVLAAKMEAQYRAVSDGMSFEGDDVAIAKDVAMEQAKRLAERMQNPDAQFEGVVPTQLIDLNAMFGAEGFTPGEMIVIAARPSVGKSALAANLADFAAVEKKIGALFFNFEMSSGATVDRIACGRARVDSKRLRRAELNSADQRAIARAYDEISAAPLYLDDSPTNTIIDIRAKAHRKARELQRKGQQLGLIIVDYLQLIRAVDPRLPREQQIAEMSRGCKLVAKELQVPLVILSQLNRGMEKDNREPRLSDLRESGAIEQDADVVIFIHRLPPDDECIVPQVDKMKLIIGKQRDGEVGSVNSSFVKRYTKFENYQP